MTDETPLTEDDLRMLTSLLQRAAIGARLSYPTIVAVRRVMQWARHRAATLRRHRAAEAA